MDEEFKTATVSSPRIETRTSEVLYVFSLCPYTYWHNLIVSLFLLLITTLLGFNFLTKHLGYQVQQFLKEWLISLAVNKLPGRSMCLPAFRKALESFCAPHGFRVWRGGNSTVLFPRLHFNVCKSSEWSRVIRGNWLHHQFVAPQVTPTLLCPTLQHQAECSHVSLPPATANLSADRARRIVKIKPCTL